MVPTSEQASLKYNVDDIREVIVSLLDRCGIPWPVVERDNNFEALCHADAIRRGFPMEGFKSLGRFIPGGAMMAATSFSHLPNKSTRVLIALYTAFLLYVDDVYQHDIEPVRVFNERFVSLKSQEDYVLDCFVDLLLELPKHFSSIGSNLVVTSTMNFITAMCLEHETQGMAIRNVAQRYPEFSRVLSGVTESYAIFVFPPELALPSFVQALPEVMNFINYANDILSFHKEELGGETVNYISLVAAQRRLSKQETLWQVADAVVDTHKRTLEILNSQTAALDAYRCFVHGYLGFHAGTPRYKLGDLRLCGVI